MDETRRGPDEARHAPGPVGLTVRRTGLRRLADDDREARRGRERWERLPVDIFGQDRLEDGFVRLVRSCHRYSPHPESVITK
jgi:hypothetical protein